VERLAGKVAEAVDGAWPDHRGQRSAGDTRLSCSGDGYRRDGEYRAERHRRTAFCCTRRSPSEPAAYRAPAAGEWGDAGRNSITGPSQFIFNASLARTFRLKDRYNLDLRVDSTNLLNHVAFTSWNTTLNPTSNSASNMALSSPLFGLPAAANAMRSLQTTMRLRF
jgi:hypothetical protein